MAMTDNQRQPQGWLKNLAGILKGPMAKPTGQRAASQQPDDQISTHTDFEHKASRAKPLISLHKLGAPQIGRAHV